MNQPNMRVENGLAQQILNANGIDTSESHDQPTDVLQTYFAAMQRMRTDRNKYQTKPSRPQITKDIGDAVLVRAVTMCGAQDNCDRTVVDYADGTRSMHAGGLRPGLANLLEQAGVQMLDDPCDQHGGTAVEAIREQGHNMLLTESNEV